MSSVKMEFVKTHKDAVLPKRAHASDSGYDLTSVESVAIPPNGSVVVPVGLTLGYLQPGWWFRIEPRSGLGFKKGLQPHLGIIDNGYRGDLGVKLYNFSDQDWVLPAGSKIAQLVLYPHITANVSWAEEVTEADRGDAGFGSTDSPMDTDKLSDPEYWQ